MRLIADGIVDREGVGYPTRQPERLLQAKIGAGPLALARAQRAQTARVLIETTDLPFSDVAFAAGFSSIRQFNDTVRMVCDRTPTALRKRAAARFGCDVTSPGMVSLRLPVRASFADEGVFGHLAASAVPGCEEVHNDQLDAYFAGDRTEFDMELDLRGTEFQQRVWKALLTIPYGETRSYGEIAEQIGAPGAARAVGLANGRNPIAIIVPCHRVIGAGGGLTGYGGGLDRKRILLELEKRRVSPNLALFD